MSAPLEVLGRVPVERGVQSTADRLDETRAKVEKAERHLRGAKRGRDLLVLKLVYAGIPERAIAPIAGITNARVHQIKRDGIDGWRKRYGVEDQPGEAAP